MSMTDHAVEDAGTQPTSQSNSFVQLKLGAKMKTLNNKSCAMLSLLVALLTVLLGCAHQDHCSMVIQAIAPAKGAWYRPNSQPIWCFAITNTGRCDVHWNSGVEVKGSSDREYSYSGGFIDWPEGVLAPGQSLETNMIVPSLTGSTWRAYLDFWPTTVRGTKTIKTYKDKWH